MSSHFLFASSAIAADGDAESIARMCLGAIENVRTFRGYAQNANRLATTDFPKGAELTKHGDLLLIDFEARWDRHTGRTFLDGRFFGVNKEKGGQFTKFKGVYDGKHLYSFGEQSNTGKISDAGANLAKYRHISLLLGYGIVEHPARNVSQVILDSPRLVEVSGQPESIRVLEVEYFQQANDGSKKPFALKVFVDSAHGYLPSRIQCINKLTNTLHTEVAVTRFKMWKDEFWIPMEGTLEIFNVGIDVPDGYTLDQVLEMSLEKRKEIGAKYIPVPVGDRESIIIGDYKLGINVTLADADFKLAYPPGSQVYDQIRDKQLRADSNGKLIEIPWEGGELVKTESLDKSGGVARNWLIVLNVIVVIVVALVLYVRRR